MVQLRTGTPPSDVRAGSSCSTALVEAVQLVAQVVDLAVDRAGMQGDVDEVLASVAA